LETFKERVTLFEYLHYNPITHIVEVIRYPIVNGAAPPLISLGVVLACTVVSLIISILLLRKLERHLVFWV
jgi:ABC-type polysaccharide/polyol phosphate export permease